METNTLKLLARVALLFVCLVLVYVLFVDGLENVLDQVLQKNVTQVTSGGTNES